MKMEKLNHIKLARGWHITHDTYNEAETLRLFSYEWAAQQRWDTWSSHLFSEWEPIDHLAHLQPLLARTPYWGRELRYFNTGSWWYKLNFKLPECKKGAGACLRFGGVDYFCRVWINERYLGEHEGYFAPFEFEVGELLKTDADNMLVVKVWAPWDAEIAPDRGPHRNSHNAKRDMMKGTYEHADGFIQKDVNPIGIWNDVELYFHDGIRLKGKPCIRALPSKDFLSADIKIAASAESILKDGRARFKCVVSEFDTGKIVFAETFEKDFKKGQNDIELEFKLKNPRLWSTWDRGGQNLYKMSLCFFSEGINETKDIVFCAEETFGVRLIELIRNEKEITYLLNGKKLYVRATTYFPDNYISMMDESRYIRDIRAIKTAGFNAVRIHVHVEKPVFYDLCDREGIAVIQDSDINWIHPATNEWKDRAVKIFGDMIGLLSNHPSVITWVCMNEPQGYEEGTMMKEIPGPQLYAEALRLDPDRPAIMGSGADKDLLYSGDTHNYMGSLNGEHTHYTEIYKERHERLNTEFGFDAPMALLNLYKHPDLYNRLINIADDIDKIQYYQYRYVKYFIEHYRRTKYAPCSGFVQFMFIDLSPQSFYGVYDWYGFPKPAVQAMAESNQPVGVFMEYKDIPEAIWVVNDFDYELGDCRLHYIVTSDGGDIICEGSRDIYIGADAAVRVCDFVFDVNGSLIYNVALTLTDKNNKTAAQNIYRDAFRHPAHPKGHPERMSHEYGMRLYEA
jgi:beta-mannosidase